MLEETEEEKQSRLTLETEGKDPSQEESSSKTTSTSKSDGVVSVEKLEVEAAPGTPVYQHPLLKDKSPEEVDRIVKTLEAATREQNEELNRQHAKLEAASSAPPPTPPPEEVVKPYGDDFLGERFETFEKRLDAKLEVMVASLRRGEAKSETRTVRDRMATKFKHWTTLEPHIDRLLRDQKLDPTTATEAQLDMLYHTAVGLAAESGLDLGAGAPPPEPAAVTPGVTPPVNIPQHSPSAAPLPDPPSEAGKPRELTENERILAKEYFPNAKDPEEEYRKLQDAEVDEIVTPGFSKDGWK